MRRRRAKNEEDIKEISQDYNRVRNIFMRTILIPHETAYQSANGVPNKRFYDLLSRVPTEFLDNIAEEILKNIELYLPHNDQLKRYLFGLRILVEEGADKELIRFQLVYNIPSYYTKQISKILEDIEKLEEERVNVMYEGMEDIYGMRDPSNIIAEYMIPERKIRKSR